MVARECAPRRWGAWALAFILAAGGCANTSTTYVTEHGLGPDKWATAWLLIQRVSPGAQLRVVAIGETLPEGIPFDVPGAKILRQGTSSAFEVAGQEHMQSDPDLQRFARIVHDIEIGAWGAASDLDSPVVEHAFRSLQQRYGRDKVRPDCYLQFFGDVYAAIQTARKNEASIAAEALATQCDVVTKEAPRRVVAEVSIEHLLGEIRSGKRVAFVDVREADEFAEAHIPGALNVPIRDKALAISQVAGADYVVSYCIKDFRGFEMAKALKDAGVENSVILNPYGLRGWVEEGLPVVGSKGLPSGDGETRLFECVQSPQACQAAESDKH
jgi:rhodanese-related sulfurtransferase